MKRILLLAVLGFFALAGWAWAQQQELADQATYLIKVMDDSCGGSGGSGGGGA